MERLSVVIATKNEEKNIRRCLESIKWADEIVVVDDVSVDKTVEIAKNYTMHVFVNNSEGDFHKNKNLGLDRATSEWILSLDADEIVPPELAHEIRDAIQDVSKLGYYIKRKNYFLGRCIKGCGWYPDYIIRLFRKGVTRWPLAVHDTPKIKDKYRVGRLKFPLLHYSYSSFENYFEKFNWYTTKLSKEEYEKGIRITKGNALLYFLIKPLFWFMKKYLFLKGYMDGFRGLFISMSSALTIFVTYAKLWERQDSELFLPR